MKAGTIIVLNGPSAAGKSSIQKAFQYLKMPNLWVKVGIDNLFDFPMPDITLENMSFWQKENEILWVVKGADAEGSTTVTLHVGNQGTRVAYAMNSAIADYASNGCDVIVDYIAYKKEWLDDLQQKLKSYEVYYVAVDISLEELERREAARETSPVGHARSHYGEVHWDRVYDLRVNTELASPEVIAKKIADYIAKKKNY
jgi:chloramphenicol 3-O phosphotransferase